MKMQTKRLGKILGAGSLAALMSASSIAFATLDNYPQPFISSSGQVQSLIVVGAAAQPADVVGAVDLAARLGGESYTDVPIPGALATVSIAGEGRELGTASQQIYLDTNLQRNGLRTALSDSDLPTLLKSGTIDTTSDDFDFDQFIDFDNFVILTFGRPESTIDPQYFFGSSPASGIGTSAGTTNFWYRTRIVFTDEVIRSAVATEEMEIFGGSYTWASASELTPTKIVIFGSPDTRTLSEGEEVVTTVEGATATVRLDGVSDSDTVVVTVNGNTQSLDSGQTKSIGGIEIFVDDVFFFSKEGQVSSAKLGIGASKITITNGAQVKRTIGGSEETIDGTHAVISHSNGNFTGVDIYVVGQDSNDDTLTVGDEFVDPVWGSFKFVFPALSNPEMSAARDQIEVVPSGTKDAELRFTNDRNDAGSVRFAHVDSSGNIALQDDTPNNIIVVEGAAIDREEFFIVDAGDFSRMFEFQSANSLGTSDGELTIRDVFSGDSIEVKTGSGNFVSKVIDGQTYYFNVTGAGTDPDINLRVRWGDGSGQTDNGAYTTLFPQLETKNGAKVALVSSNGTTFSAPAVGGSALYNLPGGTLNISTTTDGTLVVAPQTTEKGDSAGATPSSATIISATTAITGNIRLGRTSTGGVLYNVSYANATDTVGIRLGNSAGVAIEKNPAVVLVEEEDDDGNEYNVFVTVNTNSDSETTISSPVFSYTEKSDTRPGNTDVTRYVDLWGTFAELDTGGDQDRINIYYPDEQVYGTLVVLDKDASVSVGGTTGGGTIKSSIPVTQALAKLDSEVSATDRNSKHLILVGGPYANALVEELATATPSKTWTRAQWDAKGAGSAIVQLVDNAFVSGRSALVVSGYTADDTRAVTTVLQNFDSASNAAALKGSLVEWKNGVVTSTTA